jgi:5-methylcytosine-specific restriction enzyme A
MPTAPLRPCAEPGCGTLVARGRCAVHAKPSSTARGYGQSWRGQRLGVLQAEPLCRLCQREGRLRAATQVDHIVPKELGGGDERSNLQPLCDPCHAAKTLRDIAEIARRGFPCRS